METIFKFRMKPAGFKSRVVRYGVVGSVRDKTMTLMRRFPEKNQDGDIETLLDTTEDIRKDFDGGMQEVMILGPSEFQPTAVMKQNLHYGIWEEQKIEGDWRDLVSQ